METFKQLISWDLDIETIYKLRDNFCFYVGTLQIPNYINENDSIIIYQTINNSKNICIEHQISNKNEQIVVKIGDKDYNITNIEELDAVYNRINKMFNFRRMQGM
jgi:hypothetical protein